jgi:uncharacterized membrane protein
MPVSTISNQSISSFEAVTGHDIRRGILKLIQVEYPQFNDESIISVEELNRYRRLYLTSLVEQEKGELAEIDQDVIHAINNNSILSENIEPDIDSKMTFGDRVSDKIAVFGGSWTFIICFFSFLLVWMAINVWVLVKSPFDPYPFILLNLILSCIAAIQAPIIMMSQNRQEKKDRKRAEQDYKVNLKAELEIQLLNEKIDHLLIQQNKKLLEIQEVQIDYLEDLLKRIKQ